MTKLMERNTTIPTRRGDVADAPNRTTMVVHIVEGMERPSGTTGAAEEFTGLTWTTTVDHSTAARAAALIRSRRWQSLSDLVPCAVPSEGQES
ncbi:hypothetical protein GCM10010271_08450 [Streptomyces kurssanovii]|nr:hypothetical protein GCM10010271_08450 [Streptomyces kurssanovii]